VNLAVDRQERESRSLKTKWIPTGVYPDENRGGNDSLVNITFDDILFDNLR